MPSISHRHACMYFGIAYDDELRAMLGIMGVMHSGNAYGIHTYTYFTVAVRALRSVCLLSCMYLPLQLRRTRDDNYNYYLDTPRYETFDQIVDALVAEKPENPDQRRSY